MPISTRELSKVAKVSEQTVRNYTREYGALLSPAARGEAGQRLFSDEDVRIFCAIASLRKEGVPPDEVMARVRGGDIYIEATPSSPQATPSPQDAPQAIMLVRADLQRQIDAIHATQRTLIRGAVVWGALLGVIVGLALAALYMWGLYLFA